LVVVVKLAGRAAEPVVVGAPTAGAGGEGQSDLAAATSLLAALRASYGLYDQLVWRAPPEAASAVVNRDPALRRKIEADLARLYRQALRLMRERRPQVEAIADQLLARRRLSGEEIRRIAAASQTP
jgi:ATP-dependent Zn protease